MSATAAQPAASFVFVNPAYQTSTPVTFDATLPSSTSASAPMSVHLPTAEHIEHLTHINGVAIAAIEALARPAKGSNGGNLSRSQCGFLGTKDSLKTVLMDDYRLVSRMGTTHIAIGGLLRQVRAFSYECRGRIKLYENDIQRLYFKDPKELVFSESVQKFHFQGKEVVCRLVFGKNLDSKTFLPAENYEYGSAYEKYGFDHRTQKLVRQLNEKLRVLRDEYLLTAYKEEIARGEQIVVLTFPDVTMYAGGQMDLFQNNKCGIGVEDWNANFHIYNLHTKKAVNIAEGLTEYVPLLGFYEGDGDGTNPYRLNPVDAMAVFTGRSEAELVASDKGDAPAAATAAGMATTAAVPATAAAAAAATTAAAATK